MKLKKLGSYFLAISLMITFGVTIFSNHIYAEEIDQGNYIIKTNKDNKIFEIYQYDSSEQKRLDKIYRFANLNYQEDKLVKDYLPNKVDEISLNNNYMVNRKRYSNAKLKEYVTYEAKVTYSSSNITNKYYYNTQYYFDKSGYLASSYTYNPKSSVVNWWANYYPKTKFTTGFHKHKKFYAINGKDKYLDNRYLRENNTQRTIAKYYYQPNKAILFVNDQKYLTRINFYATNKGKQIYTGYNSYKNGVLSNYSIRLSGVPKYNQWSNGYPSGCEMFSLKMALAYKGKYPSAAALYNKLPKSNSIPYKKNGKWYWANPDKRFLGNPKGDMKYNRNWGINPKGLEILGDQYRPTDDKIYFSLPQIKAELANGNPVVVWSSYLFQKPAGFWNYTDSDGNKRQTYGNFHVMLVTGIDKKYVYFNDPARGYIKVSHSKFLASYKPYKQRALVVK